ncbi:uncharacterized protein LY89DRAFT_64305 [Mollisia scopiformis]|uniref:Uncharacterized protein n=1 Tax=Mollisia scopiformis TaxID=149040 RepID=A0A194XAK5_MOLSC|nr:uncharacterized protein LY89DRAFT_64305 [Mollisia scopiformis]KUJ16792.1 hypothetical protein LY89DRAFT_64305 [Mollisia scopiformis]
MRINACCPIFLLCRLLQAKKAILIFVSASIPVSHVSTLAGWSLKKVVSDISLMIGLTSKTGKYFHVSVDTRSDVFSGYITNITIPQSQEYQ